MSLAEKTKAAWNILEPQLKENLEFSGDSKIPSSLAAESVVIYLDRESSLCGDTSEVAETILAEVEDNLPSVWALNDEI